MERLSETDPSEGWKNRQFDELEVPAYPFGGDVARKCLECKVGPILPTLSDIAPAEPHHRAAIDRYGEAEPLASRVTLEEVRTPRPVVVEVTEDCVVTRPDLIGEGHGIMTVNQLNISHWCRQSDIATHGLGSSAATRHPRDADSICITADASST